MIKWFRRFFRKVESEEQLIVASMAAVPWRVDTLCQVVESIINQVDILNVYLNDWDDIPDFLIHPKINAVMSQNELGDLGAKGKFYWCETVKGFHLTIDDDIIYPENYVQEILHGLSRYPEAVVSYHGSILNYPSFAKRNNKLTHFAKKSPKDMKVALIGTGVMAYDTSNLDIKLDAFKSKNWADGWFSLQVRQAGYRCITLRHKKGWLMPISDQDPDIWMNRTAAENKQINGWINQYKMWDEMTLFSEKIRDRNLRWWALREKVDYKNISGKIEGKRFVEGFGIKTPETYIEKCSLENLPLFSDYDDNLVIKPIQGYSSKNVFVIKNGYNLLDSQKTTREMIISKCKDETNKFLVEELLIPWDNSNRIPRDYKFYMFGNRVAYCQVIERLSGNNNLKNKHWFVDENFEVVENQIMVELLHHESEILKPDCWEDLVAVAKKLASALNRFTRVDLYATNKGVVFGEFTPTPHGGRGFTKWADKWLGEMWNTIEGGK